MKRCVRALILVTALFLTALPWISAQSAGTVHETTLVETDFGQINNLVSRKENIGGVEKAVSSVGRLISGSEGYFRGTVYVDSGERDAYIVASEDGNLSSSASLTVRYDLIGYYYQGRTAINDGTPAIPVGAEVTIYHPVNLSEIALFENFWYGGYIHALAGRPGGRADYSISFFHGETGELIRLGRDAQLVASSLDGWPFPPKVSYEGISFYNAEETWLTYRSDGNIVKDSGALFGVSSYYTGERKAEYEDIKEHKTFINCGVSFWQDAATWKCAFVTQTDYETGHGEWFYLAASPTNLLRPDNPTKTTEQATYHVGDLITYQIAQQVASTPEYGYGSYESFRFIDHLPPGLDYVSGSITCDYGAVPDSAGIIQYNQQDRTVMYTFASEYLKEMEYCGQTYTFTVVCRINETALGGQAFANIGEVVINGEVRYTLPNETIPYYRITTEVVNGSIDPEITGIPAGETRAVNYQPNTDCRLKSVTVDGIEQDIRQWRDQFVWEAIQSNHHIKVVYEKVENNRSILLTKRIKAADIVYDHGVPVFLFRVDGVDVFGNSRICYQAVSFDQDYIAANTAADGYVSRTAVFSGLAPGSYTAMEEESNRYCLELITEISGGIRDGDKVIYDLAEVQQGAAVFLNWKYEQGDFSDSILVENVVK